MTLSSRLEDQLLQTLRLGSCVLSCKIIDILRLSSLYTVIVKVKHDTT